GLLCRPLGALPRRDPGHRLRRGDPRALPLRPDAPERPARAARQGSPPDPAVGRRDGDRRVRRGLHGAAPDRRHGRARAAAVRPGRRGRRSVARAAPLLRLVARLRGGLGAAAGRARRRVLARPAGEARVIGGIPLSDVLFVSAALFIVGLAGALLRRTAIAIFLSIEVMMNAANLALVGYGAALGTQEGQIIVFFVIAVAAAEASVGLAI